MMQVFAKEPGRKDRWVIFTQAADGSLARLYSATRCPKGMKRIPWPASYAAGDGLTDRIVLAG